MARFRATLRNRGGLIQIAAEGFVSGAATGSSSCSAWSLRSGPACPQGGGWRRTFDRPSRSARWWCTAGTHHGHAAVAAPSAPLIRAPWAAALRTSLATRRLVAARVPLSGRRPRLAAPWPRLDDGLVTACGGGWEKVPRRRAARRGYRW